MIEGCNMLQHIIKVSIKLFFKRSYNCFALGSMITGSKFVAERARVERKHDDAEWQRVFKDG
jgi:hypothetical protein